MTSKATNQRDLTDVIKKQKRDGKKAAGMVRAQASGISGADTAITSGQKTSGGGAGGSPVTQDLQMNTFDIRDVDRLYFSTTAGSTDELAVTDTGIESASYYDGTNYLNFGLKYQVPGSISGVAHSFRVGSVEVLDMDINNIQFNRPLNLHSNTATGSYINGDMYYDGTDIKAVVPAGTVNLTSGGGAWVGTAASDLNMATFDIDMNGNILHFDVDKDTYMESSTDDSINIFAGGSVRLKVSNTGTLFSNDVTLLATFADLNISSNNINFLTNQSISATAAGITYNVDATHDHFFSTTGGGIALQIGATNTYHGNHVIPSIDNTYDLGSSTFEWKDLRINGVAYIDTLSNIGDIIVSADLDFDTGKYPDLADTSTSVSGTGIQLPLNGSSNAACEGFVIIKVNGATKKIPYYS